MTASPARARLRSIIAALLATVTIAGCVGLPEDSEVQRRLPVENEEARPGVFVQPEAPSEGAGPEEIALGFLRAHIGVPDSYSTARQYLAGRARTDWRPDQGAVLLASSNLSARRISGSKIVVTAEAVAQVDPDGRVSQLPDRQRRSVQLGLSQVQGNWRVTSVPDDLGRWLSITDFERLYQPKRVYFAAAHGAATLIPDVRWLPESGMATALARAVLGPPPSWLTDVVRPRLPAGTRLQPGSVSISTSDQRATVTLSREVLAASPPERRALWACMLQTLSQAPGVSRVQLMVGSGRLQAAGAKDESTVEGLGLRSVAGPSGPVIVRRGGRLSWVQAAPANDRNPPTPASSRQPLPSVGTQWYHLAADAGGREVAAISGDRKSLGRWIGRRLSARPPFANALTRPAYDGQDGLWVGGEALADTGPTIEQPPGAPNAPGTPTIWVINTRQPVEQAQPQPVTTPWLGQRDVLSLAVSPEGQRLALVVRDRATQRSSLLIAGIVRNPSGEVDGLATPQVLNPAINELSSVTWTDDTTLAVLGQIGRETRPQPITVPLGGVAEPLGVVNGATDVVGSSIPQDRVFVITNRGTVLAREGRSWEQFDRSDDLAAPVP